MSGFGKLLGAIIPPKSSATTTSAPPAPKAKSPSPAAAAASNPISLSPPSPFQNDGSFDLNVATPQKKRASALSTTEILNKQEEEINKLVETFCIPKDLAWNICEKFAWKMEKITEHLLERAAELDTEPDSPPPSKEKTTEKDLKKKKSSGKDTFDCAVCGDPVDTQDTIKISVCPEDHRFCKTCWSHHASIQVKEGTLPIACMFHKCQNPLVDPDVISTLLDKPTLELFRYKNVTNFMSKSQRMRWCPSPSCQKAVEFSDSLSDEEVRCECGTTFCFTCGNEWHSPIDCQTYRKWFEKCTSEGASAKWISAFTRPCPNPQCMKPIEKNGGCPHMQCRACQKHFCWTCMELYVNGGHQCKGTQPVNVDQAEATKSFNRYRSGYMGFDTCISKERSIRDLARLAKEKTNKYRDNYSEHWNKATPFDDAVVIYAEVLRTLRFTFVLCYFAEETDAKEAPFLLFLQEDLLLATERLEKLVSSPEVSDKHKEEIKKATSTARLKAQSVISTSREGMFQNSDLYRLGS